MMLAMIARANVRRYSAQSFESVEQERKPGGVVQFLLEQKISALGLVIEILYRAHSQILSYRRSL